MSEPTALKLVRREDWPDVTYDLIQTGQVNLVDEEGWTPLHVAVRSECYRLAVSLLKNGGTIVCDTDFVAFLRFFNRKNDELESLLPALQTCFDQCIFYADNPVRTALKIAKAYKTISNSCHDCTEELVGEMDRLLKVAARMVDAVDYDVNTMRTLLEEPAIDNAVELAFHLRSAAFFMASSVREYFDVKALGPMVGKELTWNHFYEPVSSLMHHRTSRIFSKAAYRPFDDFLTTACQPRFFVSAPIARFCTEVLLYLAMVVLFCVCVSQRGDTGHLQHLSVAEVLLLCNSVAFFSRECEEIFEYARRGHLRDYLKTGWNLMNVLSTAVFTIFSVVRVASLFVTSEEEAVNICSTAYDILSLNCIFLSARLLNVLAIHSKVGVLTRILNLMIFDLLLFVWIFGTLLIGFAGTFYSMFGDKLEDFSSFSRSCLSLFLAALGEFDMDALVVVSPSWGAFLLVLYLVVSALMLVNLLVAVFASTYDEIYKRAKGEWAYIRAYRIYRWSFVLKRVPPPINLVANTISFFISIVRLCLRSEHSQMWLSRVRALMVGVLVYVVTTIPIGIFLMLLSSCLTVLTLVVGVLGFVGGGFVALILDDRHVISQAPLWLKSLFLTPPLMIAQICFVIFAVILPACCKGLFDWFPKSTPGSSSQLQSLLQHNNLASSEPSPSADSGSSVQQRTDVLHVQPISLSSETGDEEILEEELKVWRWLGRGESIQLIPIEERQRAIQYGAGKSEKKLVRETWQRTSDIFDLLQRLEIQMAQPPTGSQVDASKSGPTPLASSIIG
eukprot:GILJ01015511.1.p1 GENE.GILJ01015511.1~~GILJ01015511.1.p1  ORF type:complete len:787 (+),score=111.80 GILJ01015511.1:54-2414(+)